jgi:hypothetical protein
VYLDTLRAFSDIAVLTLSSGFMTYAVDAHPDYGNICRDIVASPSTVVLLPSFNYETCVTETVDANCGGHSADPRSGRSKLFARGLTSIQGFRRRSARPQCRSIS